MSASELGANCDGAPAREPAQTLYFSHALLPDGWARDVRIEIGRDGRFQAVSAGCPPTAGEPIFDIAVPGIANLHSHAFQRGMAGLAETRGPATDSFWTWREVMYRFLAHLTPEDCEAIAALAYAEMLEAGFTRVAEFHYLHHDVDGEPYGDLAVMAAGIATAAGETGIGLTLLPVLYAHGGFGGASASAGQRRFLNPVDRYQRLVEASRSAIAGLPDARLGLAPHSLRAVTRYDLEQLVAMDRDCPIHIHVAEQTREVDDCLAWSGRRPVEWLLATGLVDARWCLIHATHTTAEELTGMAAAGAVAGLCPITEANLGDGIFSAPAFLRAGGILGVGSDSNVRIDAAGELRLLEYAQRLTGRSRNVLADREGASTGRTLLELAVAGGARALGLQKIGIMAGAPADIVALDRGHIAFTGRSLDGWLDAWIFAARGSPISDVWSCGRHVVRNGRHVRRDAITSQARRCLERLIAEA